MSLLIPITDITEIKLHDAKKELELAYSKVDITQLDTLYEIRARCLALRILMSQLHRVGREKIILIMLKHQASIKENQMNSGIAGTGNFKPTLNDLNVVEYAAAVGEALQDGELHKYDMNNPSIKMQDTATSEQTNTTSKTTRGSESSKPSQTNVSPSMNTATNNNNNKGPVKVSGSRVNSERPATRPRPQAAVQTSTSRHPEIELLRRRAMEYGNFYSQRYKYTTPRRQNVPRPAFAV